MHWTVEASPENVSQLQGNPNIDHVGEIQIPAPPANTLRFRDTSSIERRAEQVEDYLVFARDGKNKEETKQTEEYLQKLLGKDNVDPPFILEEALRFWRCASKSFAFSFLAETCSSGERLTSYHAVSTAQRDEVAARPSVKAVESNAKGGYGRHTSRHEPSIPQLSAAKLPTVKAKRAITYSTQINAVVELVEVSQPK